MGNEMRGTTSRALLGTVIVRAGMVAVGFTTWGCEGDPTARHEAAVGDASTRSADADTGREQRGQQTFGQNAAGAVPVSSDPGLAAYGPCVPHNPACGGTSGLCLVDSSGFHWCTPPCDTDSDCPVPAGGAAKPTCVLGDVITDGMAGQCSLKCNADADCPPESTCPWGQCVFSNEGIEGFPLPDPCGETPQDTVAAEDETQGLPCDAFLPQTINAMMVTPRRAVWSHTDNPDDGDFVFLDFELPGHERAEVSLELRFGSQGDDPNRGRFASEFELGTIALSVADNNPTCDLCISMISYIVEPVVDACFGGGVAPQLNLGVVSGRLTLDAWDLRAGGKIGGRLEDVKVSAYHPGGFSAGIDESGCNTRLPALAFEAVLEEEVAVAF